MTKLCPNHVSFKGKFGREHTPASPAGADIMLILRAALEERAVVVLSSYLTDYSHGLILLVDRTKFFLELGLVEEEYADWLLFFDLKVNFLWILERLTASQRAKLANAVHGALSSTSGVEEVRWYKNAKAWNFNPTECFSDTPNA